MKDMSQRLRSVVPSASMAMAQRTQRKDVERRIIDLTWGQPDFDTPDHIKKAASEAIQSGKNRYTASLGIKELRRAICDFYRNYYHVDYNFEFEMLVTPGAKQGIYYIFQAILDQKDEVILFEPCWLSYRDMVYLGGGKPVFIPATEDLRPNVNALRDAINERTKAIVINNPVNPSGYVFSLDELESIVSVAEEFALFLIADEIYDRITFLPFTSLSKFQDQKDRIIIVNGFSKAYAMTGFRVGYAFAEKSIIHSLNLIHQHTATCAPAVSQYAAFAAITGDQNIVEQRTKVYLNRASLVTEGLKKSQFIAIPPQGTFYTMIKVPECPEHYINNAEYFFQEYGIACVDGSYYGDSAREFVRISLTAGDEDINEFVKRLTLEGNE